MAVPQVEVTLKEGGPPVPVADLSNVVHVIGPSSLGTADTPGTIGTEADLAIYGHGPGPELAAAALAAGGNPVYFTRSGTSSAGANGAVTKTDPSGAVGTPTLVGGVTYTALQRGVTVQHVVAGNNTPLTVPVVVGKAIVVNIATDGGGVATSTATLIAAAVAAQATAAACATAANGAGVASAAAATALPFGSTAEMVASGTPVNRFDVVIKCTALGALGTARVQVSIDNGDDEKGGSFFSEQLVPGNGILALSYSKIATGIIGTLTGTLAVGDTWRWTSTAPTSNSAAMVSALQAALNDATRPFGFAAFASPTDSAIAVALNTTLTTAYGAPLFKPRYALVHSRDATAGEAAATWRDAVNADFNGATPVTTAMGRVWCCSGAYRRFSQYSRIYYRSTPIYAVTRRRVSRPVHEEPGRRKTGAVDDALLLYHDETLNASFSNNRQITMYSRGGIFLTRSCTLASADSRYSRGPVAAVMLQSAIVCYQIGDTFILDSEIADPVTGAISDEEARAIETTLSQGLRAFLFSAKLDGKISATPPSASQKMVVCLQNYNFLSTNELRIEAAVIPLGYNDAVKIGLTLQIPG